MKHVATIENPIDDHARIKRVMDVGELAHGTKLYVLDDEMEFLAARIAARECSLTILATCIEHDQRILKERTEQLETLKAVYNERIQVQ